MKQKHIDCLHLPEKDRKRSSRAQSVIKFAELKELGIFHFEMRKQMDEPEEWSTGLAEDYRWNKGFLHEGKYSAFKTDCLLASFQPAHRSQWSSHELLHNIVGFSWVEKGSLFYHALSSRLSELLPVALFYFFDEIDSVKCERHRFSSALYGETCFECEKTFGLESVERSFYKDQAQAFVKQEIEAIKKSIHTGVMYENVFSGLNLTSDAMQFAKMQYPRLTDPVCSSLFNDYFVNEGLVHTSLDSLLERVETVFEALMENDFSPLNDLNMPDKQRALALDIASRLSLMKKHVEQDKDLLKRIDALLETEFSNLKSGSFDSCIEKYTNLSDEYELIPAEDIFAVGVPLSSEYGLALEQVEDGLASCLPMTLEQWKNTPAFASEIKAFSFHMPMTRQDIGERLYTYFEQNKHPLFSELQQEKVLYSRPMGDSSLFYLNTQKTSSGEALSWNPDLKHKLYSAGELVRLGVFEEDDRNNYVLLSLALQAEAPNSLYPLLETEFESIDKSLKDNLSFDTQYNSLLKDLIRNNFLVQTKWSLYNA